VGEAGPFRDFLLIALRAGGVDCVDGVPLVFLIRNFRAGGRGRGDPSGCLVMSGPVRQGQGRLGDLVKESKAG